MKMLFLKRIAFRYAKSCHYFIATFMSIVAFLLSRGSSLPPSTNVGIYVKVTTLAYKHPGFFICSAKIAIYGI